MRVTLDARDIGRELVHSGISIHAGGDSLSVLFPKWIPGSHGPCGAIENMAGFVPIDRTGKAIAWQRDFADPFRFAISGDVNSYPITISLTYICGQPTALSWGSDCWGTPFLGVINWNEVTVYPEGMSVGDLLVEPRLILPSGWKFASGMPMAETRGDTIVFRPVTFEELIDYPVICGQYLKSYPLVTTANAEYWIDVVVDDEDLLPFADSAFTDSGWVRLIYETEALFGMTPFDTYHFLVPISDEIGGYGMEHRNSNISSNNTSSLRDYGSFRFSHQWIMPHELVHAWCGKFHRPSGMYTPDYQTPKDLTMLWAYEGMTDYVGMLLSARSGLIARDYFLESQADYWGNLRHLAGRSWRSLRDIEVSTYTVWGGSENWLFHRLSAEYYPEGGMMWLEIDARIREATHGERSLDDFCRSFFGAGDRTAHCLPYSADDLVSALSQLVAFSWDSLITAQIDGVRETFNETPMKTAGWMFGYTDKKPKYLADSETRAKCHYYYESLGFSLSDEDNTIDQVVPGSPADRARLCSGMEFMGVNARVFSPERLETALTDATRTGQVRILTRHGEVLQEYPIDYAEGLRYACLKPIEGRTNWLDAMIKPITGRR
jgi:predicted metalloprotease with PDZ domain